jgi:hypothetical protein
MKIGIKKEVEVEAKVLKIYMKVRDEFSANLMDQDDEVLKEYEGYVPEFMPGDHHGDYLILDIDIESGEILNWKKPSEDQIQKFVNGDDN